MKKIFLITQTRLDRARIAVANELANHGLWNRKLAAVPVQLVSFSLFYGWQAYGTTGEIAIPVVSACRIWDWWRGGYVSLRDVLRHEYGHAIADVWPKLITSHDFKAAFGAPHDSDSSTDFIPGCHMTDYAATSPAEDFAETLMIFLRDKGRLRPWYQTPPIRRKWRFIRKLCRAIRTKARTL
jgi:hypothetical protein